MYLKEISLNNFKNYIQSKTNFSKKINCLVGDNGVGKTNLLTAIYYLSFCKSYFNSIDSQNILHEADFFSIHGKYKKDNNTDIISCIQKRNHKKNFELNGNKYTRLSEHIGLFPLVMISPADNNLIYSWSEDRRKYIDRVISQFDKFYLEDVINYNKALVQRNTLLKHFAEKHFFDKLSIEIWDKQMIMLGNKIYAKRKDFLKKFSPVFQKYYKFIAQDKELVSIEYQSQLTNGNFEELLANSLEKDRILQYSTTGIHKDDLVFKMQDFSIKKFGSQGQQKSFIIALKLAQFDYTKNIKGFNPILLFDDIFDKLDDNRLTQLIKLVSNNNFGQIFITDVDKQRIKRIFSNIKTECKMFEIKHGEIIELKN